MFSEQQIQDGFHQLRKEIQHKKRVGDSVFLVGPEEFIGLCVVGKRLAAYHRGFTEIDNKPKEAIALPESKYTGMKKPDCLAKINQLLGRVSDEK